MKLKKFKQTEIGIIPEEWKVEKLKELCIKITDGSHFSPKTKPEGKLIATVKDMNEYGFNYETCRRISEQDFNQLSKQDCKPKINDVLIAKDGSYLKHVFVTKKDEEIVILSSIAIIRPNVEKITPHFLKYLFSDPITKQRVKSNYVSGAVIPRIVLKDFAKIDLPIPSLQEQDSIAKILSDLDSKIELNQQMNKTLEAIGKAIFKRWFVDFEFPNEKGKPYKSSGGEMVDSEVGEIPKEWEFGEVIDEFNLTMGQSPPGNSYNYSGKGVAFFQGRTDFGFRYPTKRIFCTEPARFAEAGDTLVSVRAPVGDINMANEKCCIGRGVAAIHYKTSSRSYTYYSMQNLSGNFSNFEAEGTVFGSIGKTDFEQIKIIIPPEKLINLFEKIVFGIDQKIESNSSSIVMLSQIRDSLLPRLMSGKIRVPVEVRT